MNKSPLVCRPANEVAVMPPLLFPSIDYYRCMAQYERCVIDPAMRYDKRRKEVHRYTIADTRGVLSLTVPVSRPSTEGRAEPLQWKDVLVSPHGRWWEVHRTALESAYGRTPFFEFYIDRFEEIFAPRPFRGDESIVSLCLKADRIVRNILGLETVVNTKTEEWQKVHDYKDGNFGIAKHPEYWQVRGDKLGFIDGLSILDLIFNAGTEAPLYLKH